MKKSFFKTRTLAEKIRLGPSELNENLIDTILSLRDDEVVIINDLVPSLYPSARSFLEDEGLDVKLKRFQSQDEIIKHNKLPFELRDEAFSKLVDGLHSFYSFRLTGGEDRRTRAVTPVDCVEGAKLYAYAENAIKIDVRIFDGYIMANVPSRRKGKVRYDIKWISVPILDDDSKYRTAFTIDTRGHGCEDKFYNKEKRKSNIVNFCAHEIASYIAICDFFSKFGNKNPLEMSQFAIPTQLTVDFDHNFQNNLIIRDKGGNLKEGVDKGNRNIGLWGLINRFKDEKTKYGKSKTFYSDKRIDGDLRDYRW